MARVYLETSFVSACVSTRTDAASVYRRGSSLEWWQLQAPRHEVFVSQEVLRELSHPDYPLREQAERFVARVPVLAVTDEAVGLAVTLVRERVMPAPAQGDAVHVSVAAVGQVEYILSWNVRHLANPSKMQHLRVVCARAGYLAPSILTPDLLWEADS